MFDLDKSKQDESTSVEALLHRKSKKMARCTFYRILPGSYVPKRVKHHISKMPKDLYNEFFQKTV